MTRLCVSKQIFAIILDPTSENVESPVDERVREAFPGALHRRHTDLLYLVLENEGVLADEVAVKVGLDAAGGTSKAVATGVVFKLDFGYAGLADPSLWEWLRTAWNMVER